MLVDDADRLAGLENDIRIEELKKRRCRLSAISHRLSPAEELQWHAEATEGRWLIADGSQGRGCLQRRQRFSHSLLNHPFDEELVAKPRFEFCRVDVHIDRVAG